MLSRHRRMILPWAMRENRREGPCKRRSGWERQMRKWTTICERCDAMIIRQLYRMKRPWYTLLSMMTWHYLRTDPGPCANPQLPLKKKMDYSVKFLKQAMTPNKKAHPCSVDHPHLVLRTSIADQPWQNWGSELVSSPLGGCLSTHCLPSQRLDDISV